MILQTWSTLSLWHSGFHSRMEPWGDFPSANIGYLRKVLYCDLTCNLEGRRQHSYRPGKGSCITLH